MATARSRPTPAGYRCAECGWRTAKWVGRCPECESWGTVQEAEPTAAGRVQAATVAPSRRARPITDVPTDPVARRPTGEGELDRVLGGGIVPGSVILLSGEPGVGKSTLLLAVASRVAAKGARVLYVSAEESLGQVRMRAERTGSLSPTLFLSAETDLAVVLGQIDEVQPNLVIVDSVQTVSTAEATGIAGGPGQVREVAASLTRVAKERNIPVLLVGHVTKDGQIAGPRVLEHLVDVVCHFEGDRGTALRFVRAVKNRFGPTDEVGCFEMSGEGIVGVPDPSGLFLSRAVGTEPGTCVTLALEGRRAIPVEVQALVVPTSAPNPRLVVNGVDSARVAMLMAVLSRHAHVAPSKPSDIYVSTVGGVKIVEPAVDLAIALALASAITERPIRGDIAVCGEISLAGEIRPAVQASRRESEAKRLGFGTLLGPDLAWLRDAVIEAVTS
ncbi:DNA repair protein RadA [Amnibacterium kyonggiense]|uniref:DNA repair protein RadA n=1 Tax=Amnibacterium kyonggiense TaxID=595671 RepID=A0A4R7FQH6_9MICO|nr:DNA repair protein RadA [Amnibacterium kyonggiense]TDS80032.1 DNA repair protein RadA/Sms [Amnibacterium kyonggiense]